MKRLLPVATTSLILLLIIAPISACHTTPQERMATLQRAVRLLTTKENSSASPRAKTSNLEVVCHRYFNHYQDRYAVVNRVKVENTRNYSLREDERNVGLLNDFTVRASNVETGSYVNVQVFWDDGETYRWEYQVVPGTTRIEVWQPN